MFKLLAFLLLAQAAFAQTSDSPGNLFSTPPTPPLDGGEFAQIPANDPQHILDTQHVLIEILDTAVIIDEILLYTTQVVEGLNTRVIFVDDLGYLLKVTWFLPLGGEFPEDVQQAILFSLPPNKPVHILAEQVTP